jgi:hypothetical protein
MWNIAILTVMIALTGFYSMEGEKNAPVTQNVIARNLAESMAAYRQGTIKYATDNTGVSGKVENSTLQNFFPTGYTNEFAKNWTNYIAPDGTIYIYPAAPLPVNITSELVKLSQNSILVGTAGAGSTLDAPADIKNDNAGYVPPLNKISLPSTLPDANLQSYPVWLAYRN